MITTRGRQNKRDQDRRHNRTKRQINCKNMLWIYMKSLVRSELTVRWAAEMSGTRDLDFVSCPTHHLVIWMTAGCSNPLSEITGKVLVLTTTSSITNQTLEMSPSGYCCFICAEVERHFCRRMTAYWAPQGPIRLFIYPIRLFIYENNNWPPQYSPTIYIYHILSLSFLNV